MRNIFADMLEIGREFAGRLTLRRDTAPIDSVARLEDFVATRSAYIAQKSLYGYLKTRMGTRYPTMFDDDVFVQSINLAKLHVFAACLSDLTVHAVARATQGQPVTDAVRRGFATACYSAAAKANAMDAVDGGAVDGEGAFSWDSHLTAFSRRLDETDWAEGALQRQNFTDSPAALVRWAPIAPELKRLDREIVENSIKFAWRDIRQDFEKRLDAATVVADLSDLPSRAGL